MKIMQVVLNLDCGGLEKLVIDLAETFNKTGFKTTICCLDKFGKLADQAKARGIELVLVGKKCGIDVTLPFRLANILKQERIDVVHTHNMSPLFYGTLAARLSRVPVIINTRHGRAKKSMVSYVWNMNDAIIAISEDAKREMLKWNRIDTKKTRVIYNGIDIDKYSNNQDGNEDKKALNIEPSTFVFGTVARLSPEKDQFTLIDAFSKVVNKIDDAKLIFIGDGILKEELVKYASKLGISDKVMFLGFRDDVYKVLPIFDIFGLSSLTEGISLTLLEAMAAGLPIVATNVGGNPEVIVNGTTGILVPPKRPVEMAEAIYNLLSDKKLAREMGEAGKRRVFEKFTLTRMSEEYIDLYKTCLIRRRN